MADKLNEMELVWLRCTDADAINHALCSKLKTFYIAGGWNAAAVTDSWTF